MEQYRCRDATKEAMAICKKFGHLECEPKALNEAARTRRLRRDGLAANGKASAKNLRCITYGEEEIELTYVEHLVDVAQARCLCDIVQWLGSSSSPINGDMTFTEVLDKVEQ